MSNYSEEAGLTRFNLTQQEEHKTEFHLAQNVSVYSNHVLLFMHAHVQSCIVESKGSSVIQNDPNKS